VASPLFSLDARISVASTLLAPPAEPRPEPEPEPSVEPEQTDRVVEAKAPSTVLGLEPLRRTPEPPRNAILDAVRDGSALTLQATLSRFDRRTLRALGQDATLRQQITERFGGTAFGHRPDRVMLEIVRRMDLAPDVALRWLREADVHAAPPGRTSRPLGPSSEAAMDLLEEHAEVYRAQLVLRQASHAGTGPGGFADPGVVLDAEREADRARVAAGLTSLTAIQDAEAQVQAAFIAQALRTADAALDESRNQVRALDPADPALHRSLGALHDAGLEGVHLDDLREVMAKRFPVLGARGLDLVALIEATPTERQNMLRAAAAQTEAAIAELRSALKADTRLVFAIPGLRQATLHSLGAHEGSVLRDVVNAEDHKLHRDTHFQQLAELSAGLVLSIPSLGGSVVGTLGAVTLSATAAQRSWGQFEFASAAADARFDGALALNEEDPSQLWLALDVAGLVVDSVVFAGALQQVRRAAQAVAHGRAPLSTLQSQLRSLPEGAVLDREHFSRQVLSAAEAAAEDRRLADTARELLDQLHDVAPHLREAEVLGLARLSPKTAWALSDALLQQPGTLGRVGRLARHPDVATGLERIAARPGGTELVASLMTRRDEAGMVEALTRLARAPEEMAAQVLGSLRGPQSARAAQLLHAVRRHTPLTGRARVKLAERLKVPVEIDSTLGPRAVEVRYASEGGRVTEIEIAVGEHATKQDILHHTEATRNLLRYRGMQGKLRVAIADFHARAGLQALLPGHAGYEALREVDKLEAMLSAERRFEMAALPDRIASLERQLAAQQARLRELPLTMGQARIAVQDPLAEARLVLEAQLPSLWPGVGIAFTGRDVVLEGAVTIRTSALATRVAADPDAVAMWAPTLKTLAELGPRELQVKHISDLHLGVALKLAGAHSSHSVLARLPDEVASAARRVAASRSRQIPIKPVHQSLAFDAPLRTALAPLREQAGHRYPAKLVQEVQQLAHLVQTRAPSLAPKLTESLEAARSPTALQEVVRAGRRDLAQFRLRNGPLPTRQKRAAHELLARLYSDPRVPSAGADRALQSLAGATTPAVVEGHLAELRHGLEMLDSGQIQPGGFLLLGAANDSSVTLKLGPKDHFVFGGLGLPNEADVMFRAIDGRVKLHEVKRNAYTLLEKVRASAAKGRDYLAELHRFARTPGQDAVVVLADGAQFWEMMFEMVDGTHFGDLLTSANAEFSIMVEGQAVARTELRRALEAIRDARDKRQASESLVEFARRNYPHFSSEDL